MSDGPSREESARLLRQRSEMGGSRVVLGNMTREEALALLSVSGHSVGDLPGAISQGPRGSDGPVTAGAARTASSSAAAATRSAGPATRSAGPATRSAGPATRSAGPVTRSAGPATRSPSPTTGSARPDALPVLPDGYDEVRDTALACTRCRLSEGRTQVVFSDGPPDARLMVVGEAPGANEDETGTPFVGAAGKYLDLLLSTVGLSRTDSVYIANVLKCRPPGNRDPLPDEIESCSPYLLKQIDLVRPQALLAVGSFSGKLLTGRPKSALGKLRGEVHSYHGVPLVVTYHPAALLRSPKWTRPFWEDLQLLREVLDSA